VNTGQNYFKSAGGVPIDSIAETAEWDGGQAFELMRGSLKSTGYFAKSFPLDIAVIHWIINERELSPIFICILNMTGGGSKL
jgi:hypothetical protein